MNGLQRTKYVLQSIMIRMAKVLKKNDCSSCDNPVAVIDFFPSDEWPQVLIEAKEHPILMSALGGLIWYLRSVSMEESVLMHIIICATNHFFSLISLSAQT
jgi:hypothetical protein